MNVVEEDNTSNNAVMVETIDLETDCATELENYRKKCVDLEQKNKMGEIKCLMLEIEVGNLKEKNKELEEEIARIKKAMEKGKEMIIDLTGEENERDEVLQLKIENNESEGEKVNDETDLNLWKEKVKQLESQVCELKSKLNTKGTNENCSKVKKCLLFEENGSSSKKIVPSPSSNVIDLSDEDVNYNQIPKVNNPSDSILKSNIEKTNLEDNSEDGMDGFNGIPKVNNPSDLSLKSEIEKTNLEDNSEDGMDGFNDIPKVNNPSDSILKSNIEKTNLEDNFEDGMDGFNGIPKINNLSDPVSKCNIEKTNLEDNFEDEMDGFTSGKRKRCSNIVTSDDEFSDEYDDNAPICTLIKKDNLDEVKENVSSQPLKRLRKIDQITFNVKIPGISSCEDGEDDEDDESLDSFIVEGPDYEDESGDSCDESADGINELRETLDKIGRKKASNLNWDLEGEMLADFGKDPELCMRAVCALYRQQTSDEKECKVTIHSNGRGFSHTDALRASKLAEVLTDGDSNGDLNKTVEELERFDTKGVTLCMTLAVKYSKQLFEIYQNKEDPYFLP